MARIGQIWLGLLAGLLASACTNTTPSCDPATFTVAIDVGHDVATGGATSARGIPEWEFNLKLSRLLLQELQKEGFVGSFVVAEDGRELPLPDRARLAGEGGADLLISVHHDSVQPHYLVEWEHGGRTLQYSDRFAGYTIFHSERNTERGPSFEFAKFLGRALQGRDLRPSVHHGEPIEGEGYRAIDAELGIYRYDGLGILRHAAMPAVLLECGVLVNREEERLLSDPAHQAKMVGAIVEAVAGFCPANGRPSTRAHS